MQHKVFSHRRVFKHHLVQGEGFHPQVLGADSIRYCSMVMLSTSVEQYHMRSREKLLHTSFGGGCPLKDDLMFCRGWGLRRGALRSLGSQKLFYTIPTIEYCKQILDPCM